VKRFKYTIAAAVVVAVLFGVKYWNDRTISTHDRQSEQSLAVTSEVEICGTLEKAFRESSYTAWNYKNCSVKNGTVLDLDLIDSSLTGAETVRTFDDRSIDPRQADSFCELFYKSYPVLTSVKFKLLDQKGEKAVFVYETTAKICNRAMAEQVLKPEIPSVSSGNAEQGKSVKSGNVIQTELDIDAVAVETVETTAADLQHKAEELRTEVDRGTKN
jgi:hypothetical protein